MGSEMCIRDSDWLNTRFLQKIWIEGDAIIDLKLLDSLSNSDQIRKIRLPAGSVFDAKTVESCVNLESVHAGDQRVWFWKDPLPDQK